MSRWLCDYWAVSMNSDFLPGFLNEKLSLLYSMCTFTCLLTYKITTNPAVIQCSFFLAYNTYLPSHDQFFRLHLVLPCRLLKVLFKNLSKGCFSLNPWFHSLSSFVQRFWYCTKSIHTFIKYRFQIPFKIWLLFYMTAQVTNLSSVQNTWSDIRTTTLCDICLHLLHNNFGK